jgi:uncharacterized protein (DUF58 family)
MGYRRNSLYLIIILALLSGLVTGRATFFVVAYLLFGVLFLSALWASLSIAGISLGRSTRSRRSQVGHTFTETFYVHNHSWLPKLWLEVNDYSDLPFHNVGRVTPVIPPRGTYSWTVETPCYVRGEFRLGPMRVATGDPFGLFEPQRTINATERIIVYPQAVPLMQFDLPAAALSGGDPQRFITQHITTNAASVRDYVVGDSINRIHWRSTARRGRLIVKEFELDPQVDVWLFVDFSQYSLVEDPTLQRVGMIGSIIYGSPHIPRSTEEYAVVIAASIANYFAEQERSLGFSAYTPYLEVLLPERGQRQLMRILNILAVARSTTPMSLADMLRMQSHNFTRGTTLIIVTAALDPQWLTQVQRIRERGVKSVCIFVDPVSFGGTHPSDEMRQRLLSLKIPTIVVQYGDDLSHQLSRRYL